MEALRDKLPFNGTIQNAMALSVSICLLLFAGGVFLHLPGIGFGLFFQKSAQRQVIRFAGVAIAAGGVYLILP